MSERPDIPIQAVEAAIAKFAEFGIDFRAPWEGDLDDLERERFDALQAALAVALPHLNGWRDIESAPKDASRVLCGWTGNSAYLPLIGYHSSDPDVYLWCDENTDNTFTPQPTHWQPIPSPPLHPGDGKP